MDADGGSVKRLTNAVGYDGGAFFSDDGEWIVYRAHHPTEPKAVESFKALLARSLIKPTTLEIRVMRADGTDDRQVTANGAANFAPFFFRGGHDRIIFCSNVADPKGRNFDLWTVHADGSGLERITFNPTFDGFPMFSPDGKRLAFCSNRHNGEAGRDERLRRRLGPVTVRSLMQKLAKLAKTYDYLVPWVLLAAVGGITLAVVQLLVVRLLH